MARLNVPWLIPVWLITSMIYLVREALIISGYLKDPILRRFEKYGDDERVYYPIPGILIAAGFFVLGISQWAEPYLRNVLCMPFGPALLLFTAAFFAERQRERIYQNPGFLTRFPRWQYVLREYTTREERRRIAFHWLELPFRTRLLLNSSDRAFLNWADLIVLTTVN